MPRPFDIDSMSEGRIALAFVHLKDRAIDNEMGHMLGDQALDRLRIGDIEIAVFEGEDLVTSGEEFAQMTTDEPTRSRDKDFH
jgi:hypothetical protein